MLMHDEFMSDAILISKRYDFDCKSDSKLVETFQPVEKIKTVHLRKQEDATTLPVLVARKVNFTNPI